MCRRAGECGITADTPNPIGFNGASASFSLSFGLIIWHPHSFFMFLSSWFWYTLNPREKKMERKMEMPSLGDFYLNICAGPVAPA